jgi:hypothetical protein
MGAVEALPTNFNITYATMPLGKCGIVAICRKETGNKRRAHSTSNEGYEKRNGN